MWHWSVSAKIYIFPLIYFSLSLHKHHYSRVPAVAYSSNLWIPPHVCVCTFIPSSPLTGDNNTVVYLEEVPLQAFPMFQGTTKHIAKFFYISELLLRVARLICRRVMKKNGRPGLALCILLGSKTVTYMHRYTVISSSEVTGHEIQRFIIWNFEYGKHYSGPE